MIECFNMIFYYYFTLTANCTDEFLKNLAK